MKDLRHAILEAIKQASGGIEEKDLPMLEMQYQQLINSFLSSEPKSVYRELQGDIEEIRSFKDSIAFFRSNHFGKTDQKIVVIGDIHCDFASLKGIFEKLDFAEYDYFSNAIFIFLGDFLDRGTSPLETLSFLLNLKHILKDRCIFIRGNHESIRYSEKNKEFYSLVQPAESIQLFNEYLRPDTIQKIIEFYKRLPYFVIINFPSVNKRIMLVHGGIPHDRQIHAYNIEDLDKYSLPLDDESDEEIKIHQYLDSLMWGDPRDIDYKMGSTSTRFEFGRMQFLDFIHHFNVTHLIRGHEPCTNGFKPMYDNKLFTVFSSGGRGNDDSGYSDYVKNPAFCIIEKDGKIQAEHIFSYRVDYNRKVEIDDSQLSLRRIDDPDKLGIRTLVIASEKGSSIEESDEENLSHPDFRISLSVSNLPEFFIKKTTSLFDIIFNNINHGNSTEESKD